MRTLPFGPGAILVEFESIEEVHAAYRAWADEPPAGVSEVVAGARTVLLVLSAENRISTPRLSPPGPVTDSRAPRHHDIPVVYDGPDIGDVAALAGVARDDVARLHTAPTYRVAFLGFSPGFAYLSGGDRRLAVPRLDSPRAAVPAGSVALAGDMSAVYPQATPGGWRLIGRTDAVVFDPFGSEPARLRPGDLVRFSATDRMQGWPPPSLTVPLPAVQPGEPAVRIVEPGALLTIQDLGRPGWAHAGVPVGGAADRRSARLANRLVGNSESAPLLEATLGGCRLVLLARRRVAVTGAVADVVLDGLPARANAVLSVPAGAELYVGPCRAGVRVYVAVGGGLAVEEVLGSRSTDTLSGLGPAPLKGGDIVPLGDERASRPDPPGRPSGSQAASGGDLVEVTATVGPRADWVALEDLWAAEFTVSPASDRTGVRLDGPPLRLIRSGQLPSEGMVPGAVQVPPGGRPIVLGRNHPPTGGYPVAAVVDDAGIDDLAQAPPGARVRFRPGAEPVSS